MANVVGTAEPLAAVLVLAAVLAHVRGGDSYSVGRALSVAALYGLAVLGKEGAAVLPLLLFLVDGARRDLTFEGLADYLRRRVLVFGLMAVVLAMLLWMRTQVLGATASASPPPGMALLEEIPRIWTLAITWTHYVRLLVFPLDLAADYGPGVVPVAFGWTLEGVAGVALTVLLLGLAAVAWRRRPVSPRASTPRLLGLAVLWACAALLPVSNVLYLSPVIVAERTLYLSSVGAAMAFGWLALRVQQDRGRAVWGVVAVVVLAGGLRSAVRVPSWKDSDTVMQTLLEDHPQSGRGWWHFGRTLDQQGRHPEARTAFTYAVAFLDSEYQVSVDIAQHLMTQGRLGSARFFLERAWQERPEWYTAPGLLAAVELQDGRPEAAAMAAAAAAELEPSNPSMHHLLAQALSAAGRHAEAVPARRAALEAGFASRWRSWLLLAGDLRATGDRTGALAALDSAGVRADSPEARQAVEEARAGLESDQPEMN